MNATLGSRSDFGNLQNHLRFDAIKLRLKRLRNHLEPLVSRQAIAALESASCELSPCEVLSSGKQSELGKA